MTQTTYPIFASLGNPMKEALVFHEAHNVFS